MDGVMSFSHQYPSACANKIQDGYNVLIIKILHTNTRRTNNIEVFNNDLKIVLKFHCLSYFTRQLYFTIQNFHSTLFNLYYVVKSEMNLLFHSKIYSTS